jgi:hypothetical protein
MQFARKGRIQAFTDTEIKRGPSCRMLAKPSRQVVELNAYSVLTIIKVDDPKVS